MAYTINYTNSTLKPTPVTVNDNTTEGASTSLTFVGKGVTSYGAVSQRNLLQLLENFAAPTAPSNPTIGQIWYDSANAQAKVYKATGWFALSFFGGASAVAPTLPDVGTLWYDTANVSLKYWTGSVWEPITKGGTSITSAAVAPSSPRAGDLWYNTGTGVINYWNGTSWVQLSSGNAKVTAAAVAPTSPNEGDFWYDSTTKTAKVKTATGWMILDGVTAAAAAPASENFLGKLWVDTSGAQPTLNFWDGAAYVTLIDTANYSKLLPNSLIYALIF